MLTYIPHPRFPLAHAWLDFWEAWDNALRGKVPSDVRSLQRDKLKIIVRFIKSRESILTDTQR